MLRSDLVVPTFQRASNDTHASAIAVPHRVRGVSLGSPEQRVENAVSESGQRIKQSNLLAELGSGGLGVCDVKIQEDDGRDQDNDRGRGTVWQITEVQERIVEVGPDDGTGLAREELRT